jgi:hypothetical protein
MTYKRLRFRCLTGTILVVTLLLSAQPRNIFAQDVGKTSSPADASPDASSPVVDPPSSDSLPEKLQPQSGTDTVNTLPPTVEASASISGVVQDMSGASVAGAEVGLTERIPARHGALRRERRIYFQPNSSWFLSRHGRRPGF